jgi:hypothetical protein
MSECPACCTEPLVELWVAEAARVELCRACKGMLLDEEVLARLADGASLEASTEPSAGNLALRACLRCNTDSWQARAVPGVQHPGSYACGVCGMLWLLPGELDRLRALWLAERRRARLLARAGGDSESSDARASSLSSTPATPAAAALAPEVGRLVPTPLDDSGPPTAALEPFDRVSFERGTANWLAAPVALVLALLFCSTAAGRFFGALISMPFHELGHALTSWLSSRFAVPLPFFTVWHAEQSVLFGLLVAGTITAFGARSWLERRRFGVLLALVLLIAQVGMSWLVPARLTSMLQILGGALGEIVLGALVLVAFHFPLPDRLRWDFWRWPALAPGSICLAHALLLWARAVRDVRHVPWGAAIGNESDGDMNRLVDVFGWRASELASFYLKAAVLSVLFLVVAQAWAWQRSRRATSVAS